MPAAAPLPRTDTSFRRSTYLTLAIACAALGSAEYAVFPEVGGFAALVVIGFAVIYRLETRVPLLSLDAANRLGGAIGLVGVLWAGYRIVREYREGEYAALGWPLFMVALMAPVLMAAVAAKLLRREKHAGDYWYMHAAALGSVVLAAAMSETGLTLGLMIAYAACAVWSLMRFAAARADATVPPIPSRGPAPAPARHKGVRAPAGTGLARAARWTALAAAAAAPLYLITPRSTFGKLEFGKERIEIGFAADQMIDLNRTGSLAENRETAFEVTATYPDGSPKLDLDPEQRWRGTMHGRYQGGTWQKELLLHLPHVKQSVSKKEPWSPPNLGLEQYQLTYLVPARLRARFLATPVIWAADQPIPVADLPADESPQPWFAHPDATFSFIYSWLPRGVPRRYVQYTAPPAEPDLGPPLTLSSDRDPVLEMNPLSRVKSYADDVLARAVREGRLPAAARNRDPVRLLPPREYHEAIAREFERHLSESPDLTYTTNLSRENKEVDPIEDFLFNTKAGHCERFATALVLMLRSEGIPAVLVLGFKGCRHLGEGKYEVLQEHAHVWVEALITRPAAMPDKPDLVYDTSRTGHWLTLDPSPSEGASAGNTTGDGLVAQAGGWLRTTFTRFFVDYTPEERDRALRSAVDALTSREALAIAAVLIVLVLVGRGVVRRVRSARPVPAPEATRWFDRLVVVLAARGLTPLPGDTPREFAAAASAVLAARPATAPVAAVPVEWAEAYYETRFGGRPLPPDRAAALDARLAALRDAPPGD